jgi:hypothetical protein
VQITRETKPTDALRGLKQPRFARVETGLEREPVMDQRDER